MRAEAWVIRPGLAPLAIVFLALAPAIGEVNSRRNACLGEAGRGNGR